MSFALKARTNAISNKANAFFLNQLPMNEEIFLINRTGELEPLKQSLYVNENFLQGLLEKYPELIPGRQVDPESPRKWLLINREQGVADSADGSNRWSIDHLFLDQDGVPTIVEVKRSTDTRIRREVVGQMLDYAANSTKFWDVKTIQSSYEKFCIERNLDASRMLEEFLDDKDEEEFWSDVKTNLQAGKIRLVFVADKIPTELANIVEFLNRQMDPAEVLALELPQYEGNGLRTLVPKLIGRTSESAKRKSTGPQITVRTEKEVWQLFRDNLSEEELTTVKHLTFWMQKTVGTLQINKRCNAFTIVLPDKEKNQYLFSVYPYGDISFFFCYMLSKPPFSSEALRIEFLKKLSVATEVDFTNANPKGYPAIKISKVDTDKKRQDLISTLEWAVQKIREAAP